MRSVIFAINVCAFSYTFFAVSWVISVESAYSDCRLVSFGLDSGLTRLDQDSAFRVFVSDAIPGSSPGGIPVRLAYRSAVPLEAYAFIMLIPNESGNFQPVRSEMLTYVEMNAIDGIVGTGKVVQPFAPRFSKKCIFFILQQGHRLSEGLSRLDVFMTMDRLYSDYTVLDSSIYNYSTPALNETTGILTYSESVEPINVRIEPIDPDAMLEDVDDIEDDHEMLKLRSEYDDGFFHLVSDA